MFNAIVYVMTDQIVECREGQRFGVEYARRNAFCAKANGIPVDPLYTKRVEEEEKYLREIKEGKRCFYCESKFKEGETINEYDGDKYCDDCFDDVKEEDEWLDEEEDNDDEE